MKRRIIVELDPLTGQPWPTTCSECSHSLVYVNPDGEPLHWGGMNALCMRCFNKGVDELDKQQRAEHAQRRLDAREAIEANAKGGDK